MGLFSLVMSVYSFAVTLACSGINLASTRLTAKILSSANAENIRSESRKLMRSCAAYSLFFGTAAGAALFFGSRIIGEKLLCDARTVPSLTAPQTGQAVTASAFPQFRFLLPCADTLRERAAFRAMLR